MKRSVFIIIGVVLVLVLIAIWVYVLFFGSSDDPDRFADFNFGETSDPSYVPDAGEPVIDEPVVDVTSPDRLRQLTIEPTIGYQEVRLSTTSNPLVYYVEAGTGHVFSIDTETGQEQRISGTTIPTSQAAAFTPSGEYVMIQSGQGSNSSLVVAELDGTSGNATFETIDEQVVSFNGVTGNQFVYAVQTMNSTVGKVYEPETDSTRTIFTVPFREATIVWAETIDGTHYVYPKATSRLEGFLYEVVNGQLERLPIDGYGLSAVGNEDYVVYSKLSDAQYRTFIYEKDTDITFDASLVQIPDKCTVTNSVETTDEIICANTLADYDVNMPDTWYTGSVGFADSIWSLFPSSQSSIQLINSFRETGRELDMMDLNLSPDDNNLYFLNKNDRTLWLFERVVTQNPAPGTPEPEEAEEAEEVTDSEIE